MTKLYLTMPQPGETITEGTIVSWTIKEGDDIKEGQVVAELETEKAVFEHESPFEGKLLKILYPEQSRVEVSKPIALMEVPQEKADHYMMLGIASEAEAVDEKIDVDLPKDVGAHGVRPQDGRIPYAPTPAIRSTGHAITQEELKNLNGVKMSPYVRRVALEAGVAKEDLIQLSQGHPEARVTKEAILGLVGNDNISTRPQTIQERRQGESGESIVTNIGAAGPEGMANQEYTVQPYSPIRLRIAQNMTLSKQKIPHAHTGLSIDLTNLVEFREKHKKAFKQKHGMNLNYLTLMQQAFVTAIKKFPSVNSSFVDGEKPEIRMFNHINLGVAVGSEHGLVIPVIKETEKKSFLEFNASLNDKTSRAQNKKLMPEDYQGATLIFNNFGYFGITMGVQIIQYPLCATLGMGAIEDRVVPHLGGIAVRKMADLFIAFDHRILDGREAGLFLSEIKKQIETSEFSESIF